jgi:hypothetical protein
VRYYSTAAYHAQLCKRARPLAPAFVDGWTHGRQYPAGLPEPTPREISERRPELTASEVNQYLNGFQDGRERDEWRLKLIAERAQRERFLSWYCSTQSDECRAVN